MDLIDARSIITLLSFLAFLGIVIWAYSKRNQRGFDEAAQLPFADELMQEKTLEAARQASTCTSSSPTSSTPISSTQGHQENERV